MVLSILLNKIKCTLANYDLPGECSPKNDCLR